MSDVEEVDVSIIVGRQEVFGRIRIVDTGSEESVYRILERVEVVDLQLLLLLQRDRVGSLRRTQYLRSRE